MKKIWGAPRSREEVERQIPQSYLAKDEYTQNRRQLSFLLQESAFSEHIPIFCIIDVDLLEDEERRLFDGYGLEVHSAIILGHTIAEPFLWAEQAAPGNRGSRISSCAELITTGYLMGFREKLETQGYLTHILEPDPLPNTRLADMMACSHKGATGKNGRFLAGVYGTQVSVGLILTDAPLMGGDYRYPDVEKDLCGDCRLCLEACPCGALTDEGYDEALCRSYRDKEEHLERAAAHTALKCMKCYLACDKKLLKERINSSGASKPKS